MDPKRHHYVPILLLRRFSPAPEVDNPPLWRLDKTSGNVLRSSARNEAVIGHYNRLDAMQEGLTTTPETLLSWIERDAAPVIDGLLQGGSPTREGRTRLALFLAVQQLRTPQDRQWQASIQKLAVEMTLKTALGDRAYLQELFAERGDPMTAEQVDDWRWKLIDQIDDGSMAVRVTRDSDIVGMFTAAVRLLPAVARSMSWSGLRAPEGTQFVLADHPIAIHDPNAGPDDPVAWLSSPTVEVTIPLSPSYCLLLRPGAPTYRSLAADPAAVQGINLRSFAAAHWSVYGQSGDVVQQVRAAADENPDRVAAFEPRVPQITIAERFSGEPEPFRITTHRPPARGSRAKRRP